MSDLPHGPLPPTTTHLCVDMQRLFHEGCSWASPAVAAALPCARRLATALPDRTVFSRFLTPPSPEAATRCWRHYYERWRDVVMDRLDPGLIELVPELAALAAGGRVVDKTTYSSFEGTALDAMLDRLETDALVFSGVETDMCVLSTLLGAVDRGYRCIVAEDAVASSNAAAHAATLDILRQRLAEQVEIAPTAAVLAALPGRSR